MKTREDKAKSVLELQILKDVHELNRPDTLETEREWWRYIEISQGVEVKTAICNGIR